MINKLDNTQLSYLEGFVKQCQDINVDPEQLLQSASTPPVPGGQLRDVGGAAMRGAGMGALLGGVAGAGLPMIIAAAYMARHPDLAGVVKLPDLAKMIAAGGIMGAAGGAVAGAGIGGVSAAVSQGAPSNSRFGAAMRGMGRGAVAGGALGTAGGLLMPLAQLTALKARGGNIGDIGAGNIARAVGRSALTGAGAGALGGAGAGAAMGAAVGKTATAIQRIWDKVSMVSPAAMLPAPKAVVAPRPLTTQPQQQSRVAPPSEAGVGKIATTEDDNVPDVTDRSDALESDEPVLQPAKKPLVSPVGPRLTIPKLQKAQSSYAQKGIRI